MAGLIAALVINLFPLSSQSDFVISIIGVLTFSGLTAYDTQKLKRLSQGDPEVLKELGLFNDKNKEKNEKQPDAKPEGKEKSEKKPEKIKSPETIAAGPAKMIFLKNKWIGSQLMN